MADLSDAQFYSPIWGKCIPFILKKNGDDYGEEYKNCFAFKRQNRQLPGHFLLSGSQASGSLGITIQTVLPTLFRGCFWDELVRTWVGQVSGSWQAFDKE